MLRNRATETEFLARVGGETRCPAYGFFEYFALSLYMTKKDSRGFVDEWEISAYANH